MAQLTPEQLKALAARFNPAYDAQFANNLPEGASLLEKLGRKLYNSPEARSRAFGDAQTLMAGGVPEADAFSKISDFYANASKTPFSSQSTPLADLTSKAADGTVKTSPVAANPLGKTAKLGLDTVKAHPFATLGTAANAGMNVAGLLDNDKFGGQLIGTLAGAVLPKALGMGLSPLVAANVAMGGGTLGSLFDTLRAKKEQEPQYQEQYY